MSKKADSIFSRWPSDGNQASPAACVTKMKRTKLTPSSSATSRSKLTTPISKIKNTVEVPDENEKPLSTPRSTKTQGKSFKCTKTKTTSRIVNKDNMDDDNSQASSTRTPLTTTSRMNKGNIQSTTKTPNQTPKRGFASQRTPTKSRSTPVKAKHSLLVEFSEDLLVTPLHDLQPDVTPTSVSVKSSVHIETMPPYKSKISPNQLNRSHSASSLIHGGTTSSATTSSSQSKEYAMRRSRSEARIPSSTSSSTIHNYPDGEASQLTVGVRVRPLHPREHGNAVSVNDNEVTVASDLGSVHKFTYDHCFKSSGSSSSQADVFETMVRPLLENAFQGYNACLFAYGQTGSGKTYSMMGPIPGEGNLNEQTGIIPRFCCELLKQAACLSGTPSSSSSQMSNENNGHGSVTPASVTVEISYLEVYNEKIYDLLVPGSTTLRIREHPLYGPYVADLTKHVVNSVDDFQKWLDYGNKKRATAATEMNDKSSRSHTLFTVILTQTLLRTNEDGNWTHDQTRRSQINLVDLAGSERISHSVASSDRIREGVSINRSLLTLGKVMSALVERRGFVPYRESTLTRLLKDSLGGNSRTSMLATISPCSSHLEETLSTLRYASQARSIVNTIRVNEAPQDRIIRELRAEVERLNIEVEKSKVHEFCAIQSGDEMLHQSNEELDKFKKEATTSKIQLDTLNKELKTYQQRLNQVVEKNEEITSQLIQKDKELVETKICLESLNRELRPMKSLLATTQAELNDNLHIVESNNDIVKEKMALEEKLKRIKVENEKLLFKKDEEISRLECDNKSLKDYVIKTREELLNMQNLLNENVLITKDQKRLLDDESMIKDNELSTLKTNNETLRDELYRVNEELTKVQIIEDDYIKVKSDNDNKCKLIEKLSKDLELLKAENETLNTKLSGTESEFQQSKNQLITEYQNLKLNNNKKQDLINDKIEEINKFKEKTEFLENELSELNKTLLNVENQLDMFKNTKDKNVKIIEEKMHTIEQLELENKRLNDNVANLCDELKLSKQNLQVELEMKLDREKYLHEYNETMNVLKVENTSLKTELNDVYEKLAQLHKQMVDSSGKKLHINDENKERITRYINELTLFKNEYDSLKINYTKSLDELQKIKCDLDNKNAKIKDLEGGISRIYIENEEKIVKLSNKNKELNDNLIDLQHQLNDSCKKLEKLMAAENEKCKVIEEKLHEIELLQNDNERLRNQQSSTRDELLKTLSTLSVYEQNVRKLDTIKMEKEQIVKENLVIINKLQTEVAQLKGVLEKSEDKLKIMETSLKDKTTKTVELQQKLNNLEGQLKVYEDDKKLLQERLTNSELVKNNLQSELNWFAGERTFSEFQLEESRTKDKMINDKEEKINLLEDKYERSRLEQDDLRKVVSDLKQNLSISLKNEDVLQGEIASYKHQLETFQMQLKTAQKLHEELMEEKLTLVKVMEKQCIEKEELSNQRETVAENKALKKDLTFAKEKLIKKSNKIEKLKKKIVDLDDLLRKIVHDKILICQKEANLKHIIMMKDTEVYGFITDNLYPHHWEHITRKARDYAEKYRIPYEFEKGEDYIIIRHLMLSAVTKLNHFQFNQWVEKIEKNNYWSREMDKEWPWEVDFKDYFTNGLDTPVVDHDVVSDHQNKAINIGISKSANGFLDPIIWRNAMVRRHVRGIREDVDALIVHFSTSEESLTYSVLSRLKAVADRLEEVALHKKC